jgi:hypothetical protein
MLLRPDFAESLSRLSRRLPKLETWPFENLERLAETVEGMKPAVARHCAKKTGIAESWFTGTACIFACVSGLSSKGRSIGEFFQGVEPLLSAAAAAWWSPQSDTFPNPEPYNPTLETQEEFSERMRDVVSAYSRTAIERGEQEAATIGYVKVPDRRDFEPFLWLAGHHTRGWSMERITKAARKDSSAVRKQIHKLAAEIVLTPRDTKEYDPAQTEEIIREELKRFKLNDLFVSNMREHIPEVLTRIVAPGILQLIQ